MKNVGRSLRQAVEGMGKGFRSSLFVFRSSIALGVCPGGIGFTGKDSGMNSDDCPANGHIHRKIRSP